MVYQTLPAEKMKFFFVKDFFRFSLAVIAIENDDEGRKQNFSITPENRTFLSHPLAELCCTKPSQQKKIIFFLSIQFNSIQFLIQIAKYILTHPQNM